MGTVNDPTVISGIDIGLGAEFEAEVFDEICDT